MKRLMILGAVALIFTFCSEIDKLFVSRPDARGFALGVQVAAAEEKKAPPPPPGPGYDERTIGQAKSHDKGKAAKPKAPAKKAGKFGTSAPQAAPPPPGPDT